MQDLHQRGRSAGAKHKRDLDNQNKLILDALTGIAYDDDSQIAELCLRRAYDPARLRIELMAHPPSNFDASSSKPPHAHRSLDAAAE